MARTIREGPADILIIMAQPPGPDLVRTGLGATFDVSALAAIVVGADDVSGNYNELYAVTIRPPDDPVICRNQRS
jgi:hypothetical protein